MVASEAIALLRNQGVVLPEEIGLIAESSPSAVFFNSSAEILEASTPRKEDLTYEVKYDIPGKGEVVEVILHRVRTGSLQITPNRI
jgi:hypothetical protein